MKFIQSLLSKIKLEFILLVFLLGIAGVAHGFNMLHFPYFEDDEGTYIAQAWSVISQHHLAPYTYWYDHAPVSWLFIALWLFVTGGLHTFGFSLNSGRIFMLLLHLVSCIFLFGIGKKLFKSNVVATFAVLLFSLSPLAIYFQRRILLDNVATCWMLISTYLLLGEKRKLSHFILSGVTFGLSLLSKETVLFFIPACLYIIYAQSHTDHKRFALFSWITTVLSLVSLYILYALLKGEFFPYGSLLGGNHPHVSLVGSFIWQSGRKGGFFLSPGSDFRNAFLLSWVVRDQMLMFLGVAATIWITILGIFRKNYRILSLLTLSFWFYLIRGGSVIEFYVVPLIPLLALVISSSVGFLGRQLQKLPLGNFVQVVPFLLLFVVFAQSYVKKTDVYMKDQTSAQVDAVQWILNNLPQDITIDTDNYAFVDLNEPYYPSIYTADASHYYWKVDKDPELTDDTLHDNWKSIDYLVVTPQMNWDMYHAGLDLSRMAYEHSSTIKSFNDSGWNVDIRKVEKN